MTQQTETQQTEQTTEQTVPAKPKQGAVKCVVWDLDNTLWDGTIAEGDDVRLRPEMLDAVKTLDARGILNSIASRNDRDQALGMLAELGVAEYFLRPQVSWNDKSAALKNLSTSLNLGLDAFAFVDDQPAELAEVAHSLPEVRCLPESEIVAALDTPEFTPRFITDESAKRRHMYASEIEREEFEEGFPGSNEEFLATLGMTFTIAPAAVEDLRRAEELTVRTNQLNSTGVTYSYDELAELRVSDDHLLLVAGLDDKFGSYGTIGVALVETGGTAWRLKLMLMSCRVLSRGVGTVLLSHIGRMAADAGAALEAELVDTGRNRLMYVTYRFAGFTEVGREGAEQEIAILRAAPDDLPSVPDHLRVDWRPEPSR